MPEEGKNVGYRQYTTCTSPGGYHDLGFSYLGWVGTVTTTVTFIVVSIVSGVVLAIIPALIAAVVVVISFLVWWLEGRLICLGGEVCVVGRVMGTNPPEPLGKAGDNDATMNVLLAPNSLGPDQDPSAYWGPPQGHITQPHPDVLAIGRGYVSDSSHLHYLRWIHCEFEGRGIEDALSWAQVVLALLIAALLVPPPFNAIVLILLWFVSVLGLAETLWKPWTPGDPRDVNPNLGSLQEGNLVLVRGDWVYDSLHDGWNEIHAIHDCQIISNELVPLNGLWPVDSHGHDLNDPAAVQAAVDDWCDALADATGAEDGGNRDDPMHDWVIHPLIDGCTPPVIIV
jgi:hypothetical protein